MHSMLNNLNCLEHLLALVPGEEPSVINKVGVGKCLESKCLYCCSISNIHGDKIGRSGGKALGCACPGLRDALGRGPGTRCERRRHRRSPCAICHGEGGPGETRVRSNQNTKRLRRTESLSKRRVWDDGQAR